MKTLHALCLALGLLGYAQGAGAFTYSDTDLLLVFRKDNYPDVMYNLGSVSNYLGRANGSAVPVTNWDSTVAQANLGGSLSGAKFILVAVTPLEPPLRLWLSDASASSNPADETYSKWSGQRSKVNAIGVLGAASGGSGNAVVVLPASDPNSYSFIASAGGTLDAATMGGAVSFPVEQEIPGQVRFYEIEVSTLNPKPLSNLVGAFTLAADGKLNFVAGNGETPPEISGQPLSQSVSVGGTAVFSASATGTALH
jgi:hypothetical protein